MEFLKKQWKKLLAGVIILILAIWGINIYNKAVDLEEGLGKDWSNVQAQYQRRMDLIPNLVKTVKAYAAHEKDVLVGVTEARSKASQIQVDPSNVSAEQLQQFQSAQGELSQALGRLLVTIEKYPDLKANENFRDLQVQLEGTENRITIARQNYNKSVAEYNSHLRRFPNNLILGSFDKREGFKAEPEASEGVEIDL